MVDNGDYPLSSYRRVWKDICLGGRLVPRQGGKRGGEGRGDSSAVLTKGCGRIAEVEMEMGFKRLPGAGGPAAQMLNLSQRPEITSPQEQTSTNSAHRRCTPDQESYFPACDRGIKAPSIGFFSKGQRAVTWNQDFEHPGRSCALSLCPREIHSGL